MDHQPPREPVPSLLDLMEVSGEDTNTFRLPRHKSSEWGAILGVVGGLVCLVLLLGVAAYSCYLAVFAPTAEPEKSKPYERPQPPYPYNRWGDPSRGYDERWYHEEKHRVLDRDKFTAKPGGQ